MKRIFGLLAVALILLWATAASAGRIYFNAAGAEALSATTSLTCATVNNDPAVDEQHTYVTRDCDDGQDEGFGWHFNWPPDASTSGTFTVDYEHMSATGNLCTQIQLGCSTDEGPQVTYAAATAGTKVVGSAALFINSTQGGLAKPAALTADDYCFLKIQRMEAEGGCNDSVTGDVKYRAAYIEY